MILLNNASE